MDIREKAKSSYDRALAFKNLQERMLGRLTFSHSGGLWIANEQLIAMLLALNGRNDVCLLDAHNVPRFIGDSADFLALAVKRHQETLNAWHAEYEALKKVRS